MAMNILQTYNPKARILSYPYYCVQNEWFHALSDYVERQRLLPVLDNPAAPGGGYTQLKTHSVLSRWENLYSDLARASAEYLKNCGVVLSAPTIRQSAFTLCALYMLETSAVVYQSGGGKDKIKAVICTKNMELLSSEFRLSPSRLDELRRYCAESAEEIVEGKIKAVAFGMTYDGLTKPYCKTINVCSKHSMLIPLMSVLQFDQILLNMLRSDKGAIRFTYQDRFNQRQEIVTSLNPRIFHNSRLGNSVDPSTVGILNPEISAPILLTLADFQKRTLVDVPITQIINISWDA